MLQPAFVPPALLLGFLLGLGNAPAPAQAQRQAPRQEVAAVDLAGRRVAVHYVAATPPAPESVGHGARLGLGRDGDVRLDTDVALLRGTTLLPPGRYRLAARRVDAQAWELLALADEPDPMALEEIPLARLPLRLATAGPAGAPESGPGRLAIDLRGTQFLRLAFRWGAHSLNTRVAALPLTRIDGRIGTLPACFDFHGLPVSADLQRRIAAGETIEIGRAHDLGAQRIDYRIDARRAGAGIELLFTNQLLAKARVRVIVAEVCVAGLRPKSATREPATPDDAAALEAALAALTRRREAAAAAARLPERVTFPGTFEDVSATAERLAVVARPGDGEGLALGLSFGRKVAHFAITPAAFRR